MDGALVLTAARDLVGFGAEIHSPTIEKEVVYRALDLEGDLRNFGKVQAESWTKAGCGLAHLRDLWELLCKISDHRTKERSAQKDAKITIRAICG